MKWRSNKNWEEDEIDTQRKQGEKWNEQTMKTVRKIKWTDNENRKKNEMDKQWKQGEKWKG